MPPPTFNFLKTNIVDSLNLIKNTNDNLLVGSYCGAVIELMGQFLRYPKIGQGESENCFNEFITRFLGKYNDKYIKYKKLLWEDLRCGGSHSVMPKGDISLTGDLNSINDNLNILENPKDYYHYLIIYTPQFVEDLKKSIKDFVDEAEKEKILTYNYIRTMEKYIIDGQDNIKSFLVSEKISPDIVNEIKGDIYI